MSNPSNERKQRVIREEVVSKGNWLGVKNVHWIDHESKERIWESTFRTTRERSEVDCIGIVATLRRKDHKDVLVTVKQFRPAVGAYTLEMPAGLVDSGEDPEKTVHRELLEETGLQGRLKYFGPSTALNAGLCSDTMKLAFMEIDGDAPENQTKESIHGVDGECIQVIYLPIDNILQKLEDYAKDGVVIESRLDAFAFGLEFSNLLKL